MTGDLHARRDDAALADGRDRVRGGEPQPAPADAGVSALAVRVQRRLDAVNLERTRLSRVAMTLRNARLRLSTGLDPRIIQTELDIDPDQPLLDVEPPFGAGTVS